MAPHLAGRQAARQQLRASPGAAAGARPSRCSAVRVHAKAGKPAEQQPQTSKRNSQLYELSGDDGWGVEVAPAGAGAGAAPAAAAAPAPAPAPAEQPQQATPAAKKAAKRKGTPYVAMRSDEGIFGMALLQKALMESEEAATGEAPQPASSASIADLKASLAAGAKSSSSSSRKKPKLPGFGPGGAGTAAAAAAALAAQQQQQQLEDEDGEGDDDDEAGEGAQPVFQITFDQGRTEFTDFSESGTSGAGGDVLFGAGAGDNDDAFGLEGWGQFEGLEDEQPQQQQADGGRGSKRQRTWPADAQADGADELSLLQDLSQEDDWGLEGLGPDFRSSSSRGAAAASSSSSSGGVRPQRRSLLEELEAEADEADGFEEGSLAASGGSSSVRWGGSAGATGLDLEEQEALLSRYFRPDQVAKLMKDQVEVDENYSEFRKRAVGLGASDHKMQRTLRIVSGSAAGRRLVSFRSAQTRPMMEKVRQAIFNMIQSQAGTVNCLPPGCRWLDLFAGTGSVGLEALSRGAAEAHFVEMDPVVVSRVLAANIRECGFKGRAWTHTSKAEEFLRRGAALPRFAGGPFDFVSVCPPYLKVSYPELFGLLADSPLLHPGSIVFVEYPKQLAHEVVDTLGPLRRVRDRKYGRTWVAVYAGAPAAGGGGGRGEDPEDDPFLSGLL